MKENKVPDEQFEKFVKDLTEVGKNRELRERWGSKIKKPKHRDNRRWIGLVLAAAAVFILIFTLPILHNQSGDLSDIGQENISSTGRALLKSMSFRDPGAEKEALELAREAIKEEKYGDAINQYSLHKGKFSGLDQMLRAIALIKTGSSIQGEKLLQGIAKNDKVHQIEAQWILANFYISENKFEKAEEFLSQIVQHGEFKSREANELLKKLKKQS